MDQLSKNKTIVLTGGGTAGHVMPHLALQPSLINAGFRSHYIGSAGIEQELAIKAGIPFHTISTGKLRRYISAQNFIDLFRIVVGIAQSIIILRRLRPAIVFSKGGFVAVPVAIAAWLLGIPVVTHESDYSPGLANKLISPFARRILYTFPETIRFLKRDKSVLTGTPIRPELFAGDRKSGLDFLNFKNDNPVLLVMGGSQGAQRINEALLGLLPQLVQQLNVVHLTGKGKSIDFQDSNYRAFEFLTSELKDVLAASDLVVSRSGANSIFELLALKKPMLLIPLKLGSRGDQVLNANSFVANGWALTLDESHLTSKSLAEALASLREKSHELTASQKSSKSGNANELIVQIIQDESIIK